MAIRLLNVMCLAALVVFPAHSQNLRALFEPGVVAITTYLEPITEDDVDQRTRLDLLLAQKQVSREDAINEVSKDLFRIARGERAGLLSDDLVDKAFADMCSRRGVAPSDLMKTLEEKGIRLDTLRKHLRAEVARERLAQMQCRRNCEDRLDYPLFPKSEQAVFSISSMLLVCPPSYCSSTIVPLAYSKRRSFDRNDSPSRFSDSASSGSTMASTSRTTIPPTSTRSSRARAALMVPFAVETTAVYWFGTGCRPNRAAEDSFERNHGGAGIDHEGDALAVDAAFGGEMTAEIAGDAEGARTA